MRYYRPQTPFNVAARLLIPTTEVISGTRKTTFPNTADAPLIWCNFRTFGGTENFQENVYTVIATGIIETWYRPDIKSDCRIYIEQSQEFYEITNEPENIGMRNQYLQFRVKKVGGRP